MRGERPDVFPPWGRGPRSCSPGSWRGLGDPGLSALGCGRDSGTPVPINLGLGGDKGGPFPLSRGMGGTGGPYSHYPGAWSGQGNPSATALGLGGAGEDPSPITLGLAGTAGRWFHCPGTWRGQGAPGLTSLGLGGDSRTLVQPPQGLRETGTTPVPPHWGLKGRRGPCSHALGLERDRGDPIPSTLVHGGDKGTLVLLPWDLAGTGGSSVPPPWGLEGKREPCSHHPGASKG